MISFEDWRDDKYWWDYGNKCEGCGCRHPVLQRDHKIPRHRGGTNNPDNIQMLCPNCHAIKTSQERLVLSYPHTEESKKLMSDAKRGELAASSKLTEKDVLLIRELARVSIYSDLAVRFNVSGATISNIVNRKTWKHI